MYFEAVGPKSMARMRKMKAAKTILWVRFIYDTPRNFLECGRFDRLFDNLLLGWLLGLRLSRRLWLLGLLGHRSGCSRGRVKSRLLLLGELLLLGGLDVVRTQVLLNVQKSHLDSLWRLEELHELVVEDNHATILGVLEAILRNVRRDALGHVTARDAFAFRKAKKVPELGSNLLRSIEAVIRRSLLRLFTSGVLLVSANLAKKLED
jgi:hypothetical protein